jgi:hypothetical protein
MLILEDFPKFQNSNIHKKPIHNMKVGQKDTRKTHPTSPKKENA